MASLSSDLISEFVKITNDTVDRPKSESTVYGTAVSYDDGMYVRIDGSNQLTPIVTTATIKEGDRVMVLIKNHSATVTGNVSSPSASSDDLDETNGKVEELGGKIDEFDIIIADKVSTAELDAEKARIDYLESENITVKGQLTAVSADIDNLQAENVIINGKLTTAEADIDSLQADNITVTGKLTAAEADIDSLQADNATINGKLTATEASIGSLEGNFATFQTTTTENLNAVNASIDNLEATKLSAEQADLKYANIEFTNIGSAAIEEFFSKSGMIGDLVVGEGTVTGHLVGVTISGDLIEGNTIKADKLVVLGEDGLYYKLNVGAETVSAQQTEYNSLNGSIITANTITAEKINVNDLVAFDATIGGFKIGSDSIYSGVKSSIDNTTSGIFLGDDGQIALGDQTNYLKYFQDNDGTWKFVISADSLKFGSSGKDIETVIDEKIENSEAAIAKEATGYILEIGENAGKPPIEIRVYGDTTPVSSFDILIYDTESASSSTEENPPEELYSLTVDLGEYSLTSSTDGKKDVLIIDSLGNIVLEKNTITEEIGSVDDTGEDITEGGDVEVDPGGDSADGSVPHYELGTVDLPILDPNGSIVKVSTQNEIFVKYWTVSGAVVSDSNDDIYEDLNDQIVSNITRLESSIEILDTSISSLVVGSDGSSLMEQTENGWQFNIGGIQNAIQTVDDEVSNIDEEVSDIGNRLDSSETTISNLVGKTAYINMGTDETGAPCLILGQEGNGFTLQITNTSVNFMDEETKIAYVSNQNLYIESAVVKNELKIGEGMGFVWKRRANGNLGLRWDEVIG